MDKNDYALYYIWETYSEKILKHKCNQLMNYYSKERLVQNCEDFRYFNLTFVNNVISSDDINYALLKKYYIGGFKTNNSRIIDSYIDSLDFEGANLQLTMNGKLRGELLNVYLENLHITNTQLAAGNNYQNNYNNFCATIIAMDDYYKNLKEDSTNKIRTLKKRDN